MATYKVIKDYVTLPTKVGERKSARDPKKKSDLNRHVVYRLGQVIEEDALSPSVLKRYKEGEERILSQIEEVSEKSE